LILFLSMHSFSQTREKLLVIDTLITENIDIKIDVRTAIDTNSLHNIGYMDSLASKSLVLGGYIVKQLPIKTEISNQYKLVVPIALADSTAVIDLPLDDSGGVLTLKRPYFVSSDTIRINKLKVYHNCLPDSIKSTLSWYRNYNSDTGKQLKLLKAKKYPTKAVIKNCNQEFPNEISVVVNQQRVVLSPIISSNDNSISWYHGHKKGRRQERLYETHRSAGKPYTYFAACKRTISYHLFAELVFE
jgi:hypothetical protein